MKKKADLGGKRLIGLDPNSWIKWVTNIPSLQAREVISSDFQWIGRESDVLVRTYNRETKQEFLIVNELQLRYNNNVPQRMRAYAALAAEKYNLPVYPVLINILQPNYNQTIASSFYSICEGLEAKQDYQVINLWEVDVEIVFQEKIQSLLPFVPILKGGGEEEIVTSALRLLREDEKLNELEILLAFFATFVLESELVQQIMRWDMAVLMESPWYRQIVAESEQRGWQRGKQEGKQEGIQEGIQEGEQKRLKQGISLFLEFRFGDAGLKFNEEIQKLEDIDILDRIMKAIKTVNTIEELREIYQND